MSWTNILRAVVIAGLLASALPAPIAARPPAQPARAPGSGLERVDQSNGGRHHALPSRVVDVAQLAPYGTSTPRAAMPMLGRFGPSSTPAHAQPTGPVSPEVVTPPSVSALILDSDPGDWIGTGVQQAYTSADSTITASHVGTNSVSLAVVAPGHTWAAVFAAPPTTSLVVGTYSGAVRATSAGLGQPGLDIYGDGHGCNTLTGRFVVSEITWAGDGSVTTFAATFEQHCEGFVPALFGEARFDSSVPWAAKSAPPSADAGIVPAGQSSSRTVIVTSTGSGGLHMAASSLSGADAARFSITSDGCAGVAVAPAASCSITFAFNPVSFLAATYHASLDWTDDTARGAGHVELIGRDAAAQLTPYATLTGPGPVASTSVLPGATMEGCLSCIEPSDPSVAAGPSHVVEATNLSIRMMDRSGVLLHEVDLATFFQASGGNINTDPRIIWDALHGRWVAIELSADADTSYIHLAVSTTADPTGTWIVRAWYVDYVLSDFPGLGISSDKIAISTNAYDWSGWNGGSYLGIDLLVLDTAQVFSTATPVFAEFSAGPTYFSMRPAIGRTAGSTLPAVVGIASGPDRQDIGYLPITGSVKAGTVSVASPTNLTTGGPLLPALVEPPTPLALSAGDQPVDSRPTDATFANGVLWFPSTSACTPAGTSATRTCARITAFSTASSHAKVQDFLIGGPNIDAFVPGVTVDGAGTAFVGWSQASATAPGPISTLVTYRKGTDPAGNWRTPTVVLAGTATHAGTRWGDYLMLSPEPTDPRGVWVPASASTAGGLWKTTVVKVSEVGPTRLAGATRFSTAAAISAATFAPGADVAYIANAYNFPDALAGAAAAGTIKGPVLLVSATGAINASTAAELTRLQPANIIVLGGTGAVSDAVLQGLTPYMTGP